jgi:hypothetical protein
MGSWCCSLVESMLTVSVGNVSETEYKIVREYEIQARAIELDRKGSEQPTVLVSVFCRTEAWL